MSSPEEIRNQKLADFNPDGPGVSGNNVFGLPFGFEESELILLPVPWEVTASYGSGSAAAPKAIFEASYQVDLYDLDFGDTWKKGIYMLDSSQELMLKNRMLKPKAKEIIRLLEHGKLVDEDPALISSLQEINVEHHRLNEWVFTQCKLFLDRGKLVGVIGGEHSVPLGLIKALSSKHKEFGILQIDAHADLREAYEGFEFSHASVMHNALQVNSVKKLVQVGVRDLCAGEMDRIDNDSRIHCFAQNAISERLFAGENWESVCINIVKTLPEMVYISFDIDGLDPALCPNTGTPVPGGLQFDQTSFLLKKLVESGRQIIGFDLCEVALGRESDWDAIVGARVLFKLCLAALKTRKV